jgi:hypothetical protein
MGWSYQGISTLIGMDIIELFPWVILLVNEEFSILFGGHLRGLKFRNIPHSHNRLLIGECSIILFEKAYSPRVISRVPSACASRNNFLMRCPIKILKPLTSNM